MLAQVAFILAFFAVVLSPLMFFAAKDIRESRRNGETFRQYLGL